MSRSLDLYSNVTSERLSLSTLSKVILPLPFAVLHTKGGVIMREKNLDSEPEMAEIQASALPLVV